MAKKWQDVEFVDYKERQRRRRMKKRQQVQEEIVRKSSLRSNLSVILIAVFFCGSISMGALWFLLQERAKTSDAQSKMYIEVVEFTGEAQGRSDVSVDWKPVQANTRRFDGWNYRTPAESEIRLTTFDGVRIRLAAESELMVQSLEIFANNEGSKSNLMLESGEVIFDSRGTKGLIELGVGESTVYARPSLFKVISRDGRIQVMVSSGGVRFEAGGVKPVLSSGQFVVFIDGQVGDVQEFNPLAEKW